jgi:hypothetical protein
MRPPKWISNVTAPGSASDKGPCRDLAWWARQLRASAPPGRSAAHHRDCRGPPQPGLDPDQGLPQTRPVALDEVRQGESMCSQHLGDLLDGAHVGDVVAVKADAQAFAWPVIAASEPHARDSPRTTNQLHPVECAPTRQPALGRPELMGSRRAGSSASCAGAAVCGSHAETRDLRRVEHPPDSRRHAGARVRQRRAARDQRWRASSATWRAGSTPSRCLRRGRSRGCGMAAGRRAGGAGVRCAPWCRCPQRRALPGG